MANPIIKGYVEDVNEYTKSLTGNSEILIRYYSNASVSFDVQADSPINLDTCIIRNGDRTIYSRRGVFYNVESDTFYFSVEDADGNIGTLRKGVPMVEYQKLTCHIANSRPDASGDMTLACSGSFFNGSFGAVYNTLSVEYRYVEMGGTETGQGVMSFTAYADNTYSAFANLSGLDYKKSYAFEIIATDKLESVHTSTFGVRSVPVFHWGENDFTSEVNVNVKKSLLVNEDIYVNGETNLNGDIYWRGESASFPVGGVWYPALSGCSYTVVDNKQYGWYTKSGNIVTVGFYIKVKTIGNPTENNITITGIPADLTPRYSAAGGGMCSGAYVSGNNNFQCFVAESTGYITTRVQACNNASSANLTTSADGCKYPYSGHELTLSGTIVYTTAN